MSSWLSTTKIPLFFDKPILMLHFLSFDIIYRYLKVIDESQFYIIRHYRELYRCCQLRICVFHLFTSSTSMYLHLDMAGARVCLFFGSIVTKSQISYHTFLMNGSSETFSVIILLLGALFLVILGLCF